MQTFYGLLPEPASWIRPHLRACGRQYAGLWLRAFGPIDIVELFSQLRAGGLHDLLEAVRDARAELPRLRLRRNRSVPSATGAGGMHRAVADVQRHRRAAGDRRRLDHRSRPRLRPAVDGQADAAGRRRVLDKEFTKQLGATSAFGNLAVAGAGPTPSGDVSEAVKSLDGARRRDRSPGARTARVLSSSAAWRPGSASR